MQKSALILIVLTSLPLASGHARTAIVVSTNGYELLLVVPSGPLLTLAEPDRQGVLALADHLGGEDWWDKHRLGYGVVTNRRQCATLGQSVEDGRFRGQVSAG